MKSELIKIKVVKCSCPTLWYKDSIGETFEVVNEGGYNDKHYVYDKRFGFYTEDVEIVNEELFEDEFTGGVGGFKE